MKLIILIFTTAVALFSAEKPIGLLDVGFDINKVIHDMELNGINNEALRQIESVLPKIRLLNKYVATKPSNVASGTTYQVTEEEGLATPVVIVNGKRYLVFHINPDDVRIQPQFYEMQWNDVFVMVENEKTLDGISLRGNANSSIAYNKSEFGRLRLILGIKK